MTSLRERLRQRELLIGTLLTLPSSESAEILSETEFDWFFLDLEHSAMSTSEAQRVLQAVGDRKPTLVRIESRDEAGIRKALDMGAAGIIVPQVNSPEDAARVISLAKYPPLGTRSVGLGRAASYGNNFADYVAQANDHSAIVIQIEHIDAVSQIEQILEVKGIDGIMVGPYDLSGSMGKTGMVDDPDVLAAIEKVIGAARSRNIAAGIFVAYAASARSYIQNGFTLIAIATDAMLLARAANSELKTLEH